MDALRPRQTSIYRSEDLGASSFGEGSESQASQQLDNPLAVGDQECQEGLDSVSCQAYVATSLETVLVFRPTEGLLHAVTESHCPLVIVAGLQLDPSLFVPIFLGGAYVS